MKKLFSLSEIIIHIVLFVLLWIGGTYKTVAKSVFGSFRGGGNVSFVNCSIDSTTIDRPIFPFGWIFIALLIISCVILFLEIFDVKKFKMSSALPIAMLIVFIAISAYVDKKSGGSYKYEGDLRRMHLEMGVLYYVEIALMLITIALNISKKFIAGNDVMSAFPEKIKKPEISYSASSADELEKFKKLLDSGVITEDEFNEKKKQILNF